MVNIEANPTLGLNVKGEIATADAGARLDSIGGNALRRINNQRMINGEIFAVGDSILEEDIRTIELPFQHAERHAGGAGVVECLIVAAFEIHERSRDLLVGPVVP